VKKKHPKGGLRGGEPHGGLVQKGEAHSEISKFKSLKADGVGEASKKNEPGHGPLMGRASAGPLRKPTGSESVRRGEEGGDY